MRIDKKAAFRVLQEEAAAAEGGDVPVQWEQRVEKLSAACEHSTRTHIAFLGTALLAKATDLRADAYALKAGAGTPGAYSARGLGHGVLVPNATKLGLDLGVTGREPLNNQPYFRLLRATPDQILPVVLDQAPVQVLLEALEALDAVATVSEARGALRAFIKVRRRHRPDYPTLHGQTGRFTVSELSRLATGFVAEDSEGGKRAQASAAGLMEAAFGRDRVHAGRVNDPDRHLPGDLGIVDESGGWWVVFEVRDKPVQESDLIVFARKCASEGICRAGVIAVASAQKEIEVPEAVAWAEEVGVQLRVYWRWDAFARDIAFWAVGDPGGFTEAAIRAIHQRLIDVEVSVTAVVRWGDLVKAAEAGEE